MFAGETIAIDRSEENFRQLVQNSQTNLKDGSDQQRYLAALIPEAIVPIGIPAFTEKAPPIRDVKPAPSAGESCWLNILWNICLFSCECVLTLTDKFLVAVCS